MNLDELRRVLDGVSTPFGFFRMGEDTPPRPVGMSETPMWDMTGHNERPALFQGPLWLQFIGTDVFTLEMSVKNQQGRKWRVSRHSTPREVVGTAFMAIMAFLEHEARESFMWNERPIFGPHIPLRWLEDAASMAPDARKEF